MLKAVLDSTVLVSAFLAPRGAAAALLAHARAGRLELSVSEAILQETTRVLLTAPHIRRRYHYPDAAVHDFCEGLAALHLLHTEFPVLAGVCRDPNDDMILACAVAAGARYLVTRDQDLLVLRRYAGIDILPPETMLGLLRDAPP